MSINCVVIRWKNVSDKDYSDSSKYSIVNWNYTILDPNVSGLSPDLEVLEKTMPFEMPDADPRLFTIGISYKAVDEIGPNPPLKQFQTVYSLIERSADEKKISVEEAEQDNNLLVLPTKKQLKYLLLYAAISRRESLGLTISHAQQLILDKGDSYAAKVWFNHIEALSKKADIDSGIEIDLDANWENVDPEDE